ncbi:peritrophin-1 [Caerostris darwini]|uniref:Peritrophin-1 n=1 Tax=Caerostris darwini TaxID=1538125 RepID=A0AAV4U3Y7_9ARAC|nr:peritrophin-1 [Caerostris darwini]
MVLLLLLFGLLSSAICAALPVQSGELTWSPRCPTSSRGKIPRLIPDPTNCRSAFLCYHGTPRRYFCPKGQVFDARNQECVPKKVCSKENDEYTAFTTCPDRNGPKNILFPHPTDCKMFYQCDNGIAVLRQCAALTHFNPATDRCDWPHEANCKARYLTLQS